MTFIIWLILIYLGFAIWPFYKKKYLLGTLLIGIPILVLGLLMLIANWTFIGLEEDIFSKEYEPAELIFLFETERDFHGDGFSIKVDSLLPIDIKYFSTIEENYFKEFPKRHYHLGNFRISKWKKTPIEEGDSLQYKFAIETNAEWIHINSNDSNKIQKYLDLTKRLLNDSDNYYAYFFKDHPYELYGIDLYVISPSNGLVVKINKQ